MKIIYKFILVLAFVLTGTLSVAQEGPSVDGIENSTASVNVITNEGDANEASVQENKTYKYESENFILIGDLSRDAGLELIQGLEGYRAILFQVINKPYEVDVEKLLVFVARDKAEFIQMTEMEGVAGVYFESMLGSVFMMRYDDDPLSRVAGKSVAFHEYTHHFISRYTDQDFPQWYSEGFAEYYSGFELDADGNFVVGTEIAHYMEVLNSGSWMPLYTVFNALDEYPFKFKGGANYFFSEADYFYAQSWLLTHYFHADPERKRKLYHFFGKLDPLEDTGNLFQQEFSVSPVDFYDIIKGYSESVPFVPHSLAPDLQRVKRPILIQKLDAGMRSFYHAEAMRQSMSGVQTIDELSEIYDELVLTLGGTPAILTARADIARRMEEYPKALEYTKKALKLDPKNVKANTMAGASMIEKNMGIRRPPLKDIMAARAYLEVALEQDPNANMAHYYYAVSFLMNGKHHEKAALTSALRSVEYYRSKAYLDYTIGLVPIFIENKRFDIAHKIVNRAMLTAKPYLVAHARRLDADILENE